MDKNEAIKLIQSINDSIKENPAQFQIEVNVIGQSITSHGGTGLNVTATGGGPGSTTIGQQVSVKSGDIEFVNKRATKAMSEQFNALLDSLTAIQNELSKEKIDKNAVEKIYQSLKNKWVPGVITSVLGNALALTLGIVA